ncbi:MAG: PAS domain-containing sensor histidine kinase [Syntrophales bacterium]
MKNLTGLSFFKNFFLNLSLNKKLILMMLFLSAILLTILLIHHWQTEKALVREFEKQTADLSKAIQVGVEKVTGSMTTRESGLEQYLKTLKSKGIKEISVISTTDEVIASSNPTKVGKPLSPKKKELIIKAQLGEQFSEEGKTYNVMIPVIAGKTHYGYIHLQINTEDVSELQKRNTIKRIVATLLVFSFGIAISVFLSLWYTEPIHHVVEAARRVATGDLNQNLPVDRKDEIGDLMQSFNFMVEKLREEKKLEERLREAEHLSAVGQLSRSIAHEIRNPLNYISLCIDHIKEKYRPQQEAQAGNFEALISSIKHEIHRLDKLVSDFLDYGKPLKLNVRRINIQAPLNDVLEIVKAKADSDKITIVENYGFLPELMVDPELIKTCIFNIIINALQAMPDGGTLSVRTERGNGNFVLHVNDTGFGISRESLSRVFEPFFTTKANGLGLGLAITKRVIEEHGGRINVSSVEGQGSDITISLPLLDFNHGKEDSSYPWRLSSS